MLTNSPITRTAPASKTAWTNQQILMLSRMYHKGAPIIKIAQRLQRTPDGIQKALLRFKIRKKRAINHNQRLCPLCHGKRYVPVNGNERKIEK